MRYPFFRKVWIVHPLPTVPNNPHARITVSQMPGTISWTIRVPTTIPTAKTTGSQVVRKIMLKINPIPKPSTANRTMETTNCSTLIISRLPSCLTLHHKTTLEEHSSIFSVSKSDRQVNTGRYGLLDSRTARSKRLACRLYTCPFTPRTAFRTAQQQLEVPFSLAVWACFLCFSHVSLPFRWCFLHAFSDNSDECNYTTLTLSQTIAKKE